MATQLVRSPPVENQDPTHIFYCQDSSSQMYRSLSPKAPRRASASEQYSSMVCVNCFQAKGESELITPCQNPQCRFYLQTPGSSLPAALAPSRSSVSSTDKTSFDLWSPFAGQNAPQQQFHMKPASPSSLWAYPPSSMFNSAVSKDSSQQKKRSHSSCYENEAEKIKTSRLLRSRLMSLPMSEVLEQVDGNDIVEDAFISSPSFAGEEVKPQRLSQQPQQDSTDKDSGLGSPYCMLDWLDPVRTNYKPSDSSSYFDMDVLKTELNAVGVAPSGYKLSPPSCGHDSAASDPLRQFLLAGQFNSFLQSNDMYSRKVFVGGLPPDLGDEEIKSVFARFGPLTVDWPHKLHTKACVPPKGYAFLLFKDESSVHNLLHSCTLEGDKHFIHIPTNTLTKKKVQIRPWCLSDSLCFNEPSDGLDLRKAVFVGGVPRPLKAAELAQIMCDKYGSVRLVAIDCDTDLRYPKGAACVVFSSHTSYIAAVSARFVQLSYAGMDKKIEIKPYILEGQMCDECHGVQCNKKPAPFYCASINCLQYYCEYCWATIHSMPGKQNHRPLQKDIKNKNPFC